MSLNVKVYINIILVILILTIVLSNINIKIDIGRNVDNEHFTNISNNHRNELEKYADKIANIPNRKMDRKMDRNTDASKNMETDSKAMETNSKAMETDSKDNKEHFDGFSKMSVKPENYFGVTNNVANFGSNVMDVNKFYSNSFGDIEFMTPYNGNAGNKELSAKQILDGSDYVNKGSDGISGTYKPDMWQYKNEMVMNGGNLFGNISGYDDMDSGLAVFNGSSIVSNTCSGDNMNSCANGNDDLRMGLGSLGEQQRKTT